MLDVLGVGRDDELLYRHLLHHPSSSLEDLRILVGRTPTSVRKALTRLAGHGLVNQVPGRPVRYVATRPDIAVDALAATREEQFERSRTAARALLAELPVDRRHRPEEQVEIIVDRDAVASRFRQLQHSVEHEILVLDRPPYAQDTSEPNPGENPLLSRGVKLRGIYAPESFEIPGAFALTQQAMAAGEEARVHPNVPMKMVICDTTSALLPLTDTEVDTVESALVVHNPTLVGALAGLFEMLWRTAHPLPVIDPGPDGWAALSTDGLSGGAVGESQLLALLATGLKDEAIARQLGVSLRTVHRRTSELMDALGARTRFQAGMAAQSRGLLH